jgi:hypothetical protein
MDRNPAPSHAAHDELLLARLYGGDLEGRELERAREMVISCRECAAVLADFEAIAAATVAMSIPPRPRDFTIGPAEARALRQRGPAPKPGLRGIVSRLGPVRALGTSMTAAGIAGILALGAISISGQTATSSIDYRQAAEPGGQELAIGSPTSAQAPNAPQDKNGAGTPAPSGEAADWASADTLAAQTPEPNPGESGSPRAPAADDGAQPGASEATTGSGHAEGGGTREAPPAGQAAGSDSGPLWLAGFGCLAVGGLVLVVVPTLRRRRSAGGTG